MTYQVIIENAAQKDFKRLPKEVQVVVQKSIDALESNPRPVGFKKLSGSKDGYRVRSRNYRILYTIDDKVKVVTLYRIRDRKDVYR